MAVSPNDRVRKELMDGEDLLWQGQPVQGVRLRAADVFAIPFSVLWAGFAFFWEASVLGLTFSSNGPQQPVPSFFALWGIPFCLMGLYMVFGRFFFDALSRSRTHYAVTSRRILILKSGQTQSLPVANLPSVNLSEGRSGRGTIHFGQPAWWDGLGITWGRRVTPPVPVFEGITDARRVYNLILGAQGK